MAGEPGAERQQPINPINPPEQTSSEIDTPKKNEVSIATIIKHMNKMQLEHGLGSRNPGWGGKEVIESIKKTTDFEEPIIRGPVEVAEGEELILALNYQQMRAAGELLGFYDWQTMGKDYFVEVEGTGKDPKKVEAKLKYVSVKPQTDNHFVVSEGLVKELGMGEQKRDIRILSAYQKVKNVNLDHL